jgi:Domain of unknown function (DUF4276)
MQSVSLTLLADGTSDHRMLMPLIEALMDEYCPVPFQSRIADWLPEGTKATADRVRAAIQFYPCDLLFVHRDAESTDPDQRETEIRSGVQGVSAAPSVICIVPVRMTEAWLLTSEAAIRAAVGNPTGVGELALPRLTKIESVDAKAILLRALEAAKDLGSRRNRRFKPEEFRHRVAELLDDLTQLRKLKSFNHFESQVRSHFSSAKLVNA